MSNPKFSVIIPAYNQAQFLADALQSVLAQTEPDFEIIVVNDASPDNTAEVAAQYNDPRIRLLKHAENKGLPASRNTGMQAASGDFIALLDSDDYFHPEKLAAHADFFNQHADIDITYNNRYELHHSSTEIRAIYQPPESVTIADLVMGFPFSPSDMVMRRACVDEVGMFDARYRCGGEDLDYPCRLALAQKRFGRINRVLNYRRYHAGRKKKNLPCRLDDYTKAMNKAFDDPRFPPQTKNIRSLAFANRYLEVACWALTQEDYALGNELLGKIHALNPAHFSGQPAQVTKELLKHNTRNINQNHEENLRRIFAHLAPQFQHLQKQLDWAIPGGYLRKGLQEIMWGRSERGQKFLEKAKQHQAKIDNLLLEKIVAQLLLIQDELGNDTANIAFKNLCTHVLELGGNANIHELYGIYGLNRAFHLYQTENYPGVLREIFWVLQHAPEKLLNRGVASITLKSATRLLRQT